MTNSLKTNEVQIIHDYDNSLVLPRDAECYFNWRSFHFNDITLNAKLKELGFLLAQGFNLRDSIDNYKINRDSYTNSSISQTIIFYIMYIRYKDYYHFISEILQTLSENRLIQLLLYELSLVYDPLNHDITCMFWSDSLVMESAKKVKGKQNENDKLISVIVSSEMVKAALSKEIKID